MPPLATDQAPLLVSSASKIRGVLRGRDFRRLWLVMSFSSFGDWLGLLATTALAADLGGSYQGANFALGGVLVVRLLPAIIFGPLAGAFADRFDRRRTMVVADLIRFALFASIPLVGTLWWLLLASFLIECVALFWIPAKEASVPNLVRRDQLESANQLSLVTTYGITPVAAAGVFSLLALVSRVLAQSVSFFRTNQVDLALYINALTFLVSALTVLRIRRISRGGWRPVDGAESGGLFRLLREGWAFVHGTPLVRGLVIGILAAFAASGAVIGTGKTYAASIGGGDATYGVLFGAVFIGLGLGMILGPRFARDLSRRRLFGLSIMFAGGCLVAVSFMPHLVLSALGVIGVGFGGGVAYLCGATLLGAEVADEVRGRTFAFVQSLVRVDLILTLAAVPFLVGLVRQRSIAIGAIEFTVDGTRILLAFAGLLAFVGGVVAYKQMDDRRGVPVLADVVSAVRGDTTARRRLTAGGMLIALEGGEGSGKSTQVEQLAQWLADRGVSVTVTHEPGATEFGARLRRILLDSPDGALTPRAEALLFAADRAQHVDTVIRPALDRGDVVITDRYMDSSLAYQGAGRALSVDDVRRLSRWATNGLVPDLTVLLDLDPEVGLERVQDRSGTPDDPAITPPGRRDYGTSAEPEGGGGGPDRIERESLEFHRRVRQAFRALADAAPDRYLVVDGSRHPEAVATIVRTAVGKRLVARRADQDHRTDSHRRNGVPSLLRRFARRSNRERGGYGMERGGTVAERRAPMSRQSSQPSGAADSVDAHPRPASHPDPQPREAGDDAAGETPAEDAPATAPHGTT